MLQHLKQLSLVFISTILFLGTTESSAQYSREADIQYFPMDLFQNSGRIIASPLKWKGKDWLVFGSVTAGTAALVLTDSETRAWIRDAKSPFLDDVSKYVGEPFGRSTIVLPAVGLLYIGSRVAGDDKLAVASLDGLQATLIAGGATFVLKHLLHRRAPDTDDNTADPNVWMGPWPLRSDFTSFPSAHTSIAFGIASVFSEHYREHKWVGRVLYTLAGITALSRVYDNAHWFSDVFAGAAIGIYVGKTITRPDRYSWSLNPNAQGGMSFSLSFSF